MSHSPDPVAARRQAWAERVSAGALEAYAELVSDDVVWLPPRGTPIVGRAAFTTWLAPFFARYAYQFSVEPTQVRAFDGWCAETGRFRSVLRERTGGEPMEHTGSYFVLWRRDADGAWRIERYVDGIRTA